MRCLTLTFIALGLGGVLGATSPQPFEMAIAQEVAAITPPQGAGNGLALPLNGPANRNEVLLASIAAWLSEHFQLPATNELPALLLVPQARMAALRYRKGKLGNLTGNTAASGEEPGSILALYDPLRRSIYLAEGWHGDTPIEVSILVHEMVHFLQDIARQEFECPQAQERMAYAAQERWLAMSGHSLAKDFDVDDFTLLVRSNCLH